jgi:hypothetical protein
MWLLQYTKKMILNYIILLEYEKIFSFQILIRVITVNVWRLNNKNIDDSFLLYFNYVSYQ